MRRCFGHAPRSLSALRTWIMRERERACVGLICSADCLLHLVIACVQAVGALYGFVLFSLLVLGYPQTAVWIHLLLPWACHLDPIFIPPTCSGGYLNMIRACLDRTRQQEKGVCIYHSRHLQRERSSSINSSSSSPQEHSTGDI